MFKEFFFLVLMGFSLSVHAQTNAVEAKAAYMLAEESYDKGDYPAALKFLQTTKNNLGSVNSKILYLETQAYAELYKVDKSWSAQLIKSIESFQAAPDIASFNEDKVLEVVKLKITLADQAEKEAAVARVKREKEEATAKKFDDYHYANWPYGITIDELKVLNKDSLLFKTSLKSDFYKSNGVTKYHQSGISYSSIHKAVTENYAANNVYAAFTNKEGRIISYNKVIYHKSKRRKDEGLEASRAEVLKLIAKQSALLGQEVQLADKFATTTTNNYFWQLGNKSIIWFVLLIPGPQWSSTIVEEIVVR